MRNFYPSANADNCHVADQAAHEAGLREAAWSRRWDQPTQGAVAEGATCECIGPWALVNGLCGMCGRPREKEDKA